jgi:hypothetical protein
MSVASNPTRFFFISSLFTRKKGYIEIKSSSQLKNKRAVAILNSFTPQGASPKGCIRIATYGDMIGAGYYWMEDDSNARISTFLQPISRTSDPFLPPIKCELIPKIAQVQEYFFISQKYESQWLFNITKEFGIENAAAIFYSLLCGDNIILVHPEPETRMKFLGSLMSLMPGFSFQYNRITSSCAELDGNENIVGIDQLPRKYRSHKKLYLPLDTIFVDLKTNHVEGEGMKNSHFTKYVMEYAEHSLSRARETTYQLYDQILQQKGNFDDMGDSADSSLVHRIEAKLGLRPPEKEDWMMF